MQEKIKILFLASNPTDVNFRPRFDIEFKEIRKKLRLAEFGDRFELVSEFAVTPDDLTDALLEHKPQILHFSGHGSQTDGIVLENAEGKAFRLDKAAFANLIKVLPGNIRMVVLNACFSADQGHMLEDIVDFTVGMDRPIGDNAATTLAVRFYQVLASGASVQAAFHAATTQIAALKLKSPGD